MIAPELLREVDAADVYKGDRQAGTLSRVDGTVVFRYLDEYLADPQASAIAWTIPKSADDIVATGGSVPPFFAGLLPEGIRLSGAVAATKTSEDDHFTVLLAVGADTVGDVRVIPRGAELVELPAAFDPATSGDANLREWFDRLSGLDSVRLDPAALPGVQAKVSASRYSAPVATASGAAILKLAPPRIFPRLIENEHFFMDLASECGLLVAEQQVIHDRDADAGLLVTRFDRAGDGSRRAQEDACQVLGVYPAAKYRIKTEQVITALATVCERGGGSARAATLEALRLVAYSYVIGNGDLHGKNFSVYLSPAGIWSVTPGYDLLCTQPYASWNDAMALNLYGRNNKISRKHIVESGSRLGLPVRLVERMLDQIRAGIGTGLNRLGEIGFDAKQTERLARLLDRRIAEIG